MKTDSRPHYVLGKALAVSLLATAAFEGTSYSQLLKIGVSFVGRGNDQFLGVDEQAGLFSQADWNNLKGNTAIVSGNRHDGNQFQFLDGGPGPYTSLPLFTDDNTATTLGTSAVTLTVDTNDSWNSDGPTNTPNDKLMKGLIKVGGGQTNTPKTLTLNNLNTAFRYTLVAYTTVNNANATADFSLVGAATYPTYFITEENAFDGTFTLGNSTDPLARTPETDYVQWSNVLPDATGKLNITWKWQGGGDGAGFSGFQLIELGPPAGPDKFYNVGAGAGAWDTTSMVWRTANTAGASDATFAANDKANFGNLGTAGARTVTVVAGGVSVGGVTVNNSAANPYTIGGGPIRAIALDANFLKDGDGALTLTGANEFAGSTTIKHGTVNVATIGDVTTAGNLGKGAGITLGDAAGASDAVLNYTGATASAARSLTIDVTGGNVTVATGANTLTLTGNLDGTGPLTKGGPGNLVVTGSGGNFTGAITVPQGNLSVRKLGSGTGAITLGTTGVAGFTYAGGNQTDGRSLTVGASNATVTVSDVNARYQLTGPATANTGGNLTVAGPGRLALAGKATFTNFPTINAGGTLALQNEATGAGANVLPATALSVPQGTLEIAPNALGANTQPITLSGGTVRLGHEGLLGDYYSGGADQGIFSGTSSQVNDFIRSLGAPTVSARTNTAGQTNLDFNNGNGGNGAPFASQGFADVDNLRAHFTGKILITSAGDTTFFTQSDDGSAIFIDGQRVVDNNFFQGFTERQGTVNLTAGLHDINTFFYEGGGGAGFLAQYTPAGGTKQPIPNAVLYAGDTYNEASRNYVVTANSGLEIGSAVANLGTLTQAGGTVLSVTGSAKFTGTTRTGAGAMGINNRVGNVNLGPITATTPVITKDGTGALVVSNALPAGSTINVNAGLLVAQGSETGGTTTDPLGSATITYAAGAGLGLSATAGNPTYNRSVSSVGSYRIEAGRFDGPVTAPTTVTLQNAGLTIAAGATLATRAAEDFTLNINAPISGAGAVTTEEGLINFSGASVSATAGFTVNVARVNITGPLTTGPLSVTNTLNGVTPFGANNTARLAANGTVNASSVTVTGGSFTATGALTNTGALNLTGGTVNLSSATNASVSVANSTLTTTGNLGSTGALAVAGGGTVTVGGTTNAGTIGLTGNGALTVRNNVTTTSTTLAPGTTLNLDMGAGNTRTYSGTVTGNETSIRAVSGTTDFASTPVSFSAYTVQAGLLEGLITNTFDLNAGSPGLTTPNPGVGKNANSGGVRLFTRLGETNTKDADRWGDNETWVYTGEVFDADGTFTFGENIDDDTRLFIDGNLVLNSGCCGEARSSNGGANNGNDYGLGASGDGWHRFEVRFRNGGGGAGSDPTGNGWGVGDNPTFQRKGFGLNAAGTTSVAAVDYIIPVDPGNATVFRYAVGGGAVTVDSGATLKVGSTSNSRSITLNGAAGSPATFQINDNTSATSSVGNVINLLGTSAQGVVTVGTNDTFTVGKLALAAGSTLTKNGAGTLVVTGNVTEVLGGPAPSTFGTGSVAVTGGTLLFNATSTGTGGAAASVAGTIGGTGTFAGPLTATSGGTIAPGNPVGTLSSGDLAIGTGASLRLELTSATVRDQLNVTGTVNIANSTLVTSLLSYTGTVGDVFFVILNDGADAVTGTFAGLPDQSTFTVGGNQFQISYDANSSTQAFNSGGNDVALLAVPEPGSVATLISGLGMLVGLQRFRRRTQA